MRLALPDAPYGLSGCAHRLSAEDTVHSAGTYVQDEDGTRYYVAYCTFCRWSGTQVPSHKVAAEEAVQLSDTAVLLRQFEDMKFSYPDVTWEDAFSLYDVEDQQGGQAKRQSLTPLCRGLLADDTLSPPQGHQCSYGALGDGTITV